MDVRFEQPEKAQDSIVSILSGNNMFGRAEQPKNANSPIVVTPGGRFMETRE